MPSIDFHWRTWGPSARQTSHKQGVNGEQRLLEKHWETGAGFWDREDLEEKGLNELPEPGKCTLTLPPWAFSDGNYGGCVGNGHF